MEDDLGRVLIAGCGYVGSALGTELVADGHEVFGLRRRVASLPEGVHPVEADLNLPASLSSLPEGLDYVVYMAGPAGRDDALYKAAYVDGLRNLLEVLEARSESPRRIIFVSSTAVYGQSRGEWVDESSLAEPLQFSRRRLREAETLLLGSGFAGTVLRFGGIYGPRRTRLIERVRTGSATYSSGRPHYTNRIHRDDCAGVLRHLVGHPTPEKLYLGVDSDPAEEAVVLRWLAGTLGAPPPRPAPPGPGVRSSKRCRNDLLLASGYEFRYPSFRDGYAELLAGQV